jgi:hypothetical protein
VISCRVIAFHAPNDIDSLTARGGADEDPRERPQATQEGPEDEMGRVDEEHMALSGLGGVQTRLQLGVEKSGLGFHVLGQLFWGGMGIKRTR